MQSNSLQEIKKELKELNQVQLAEITLQLAKYKKENKDFLGFLLFQSHDKELFKEKVNQEVDELITRISLDKNLYFVKKSLRKILRLIAKYTRYVTEDISIAIEFRLHFCHRLKKSGIRITESAAIINLYLQEIKKIESLVLKLHPDLQNDYKLEIENLKGSDSIKQW
jgi:hypothetical protein